MRDSNHGKTFFAHFILVVFTAVILSGKQGDAHSLYTDLAASFQELNSESSISSSSPSSSPTTFLSIDARSSLLFSVAVLGSAALLISLCLKCRDRKERNAFAENGHTSSIGLFINQSAHSSFANPDFPQGGQHQFSTGDGNVASRGAPAPPERRAISINLSESTDTEEAPQPPPRERSTTQTSLQNRAQGLKLEQYIYYPWGIFSLNFFREREEKEKGETAISYERKRAKEREEGCGGDGAKEAFPSFFHTYTSPTSPPLFFSFFAVYLLKHPLIFLPCFIPLSPSITSNRCSLFSNHSSGWSPAAPPKRTLAFSIDAPPQNGGVRFDWRLLGECFSQSR